MIQKREVYERQDDGTILLVRVEEYETPDIDPIKEKEEELLKLYAELEALKNNQQNNAN
jgi:hypothetical protein